MDGECRNKNCLRKGGNDVQHEKWKGKNQGYGLQQEP